MIHRRSRPAKTISSYKQAYQQLIRHRTWKNLRLRHLFFHDRCEKCGAGWADKSLEVHHIKPLADAHSFDEMRELAYKGSNLVTLCHRCHCEAHKEARGHAFKKGGAPAAKPRPTLFSARVAFFPLWGKSE